MSGFVYVVKSGDKFKIGFTNQAIDKRINNLQTGSPTKINLVMYFESDTPNLLEKQLHRVFKNKRLDGEWFSLNQFDIDELSSMDGAILNDYEDEGVIIFRDGMKEIIRLGKSDASASQLLMYMIFNMDDSNCILQSGESIAKQIGCSLRSVRSKINLLNDAGFITTLKSGNSNVYCVNSHIAWNNHINMIGESKFSALIGYSSTVAAA